MELKKDQKITIIRMTDMAMAARWNAKVVEDLGDHFTFKMERKRKVYKIAKDKCDIVLKGWEHPFRLDSEGSCFMMDACITIVSNMFHGDLRFYLEENSLNVISDNTKGILFNVLPEDTHSSYNKNYEDVLYPEIEVYTAPMQQARAIHREQK